jgi:hypothetical protein
MRLRLRLRFEVVIVLELEIPFFVPLNFEVKIEFLRSWSLFKTVIVTSEDGPGHIVNQMSLRD